MSTGSQQRVALLALIGGATGIGFAPVLVRLTDTGPSATAFYRILFALPFLWAWAAQDRMRRPQSDRPSRPSDYLRLAATGLFFAADLSIWHWSLQFTSVANSTILTNIAPIFVTLGAWLFLEERVTGQFIVSMALATAGGILLARSDTYLPVTHWRGDFLALVAAVFYAGYLLMVKMLRREFGTPTIMAWSGLASGPAFGAIGWLAGDNFSPHRPGAWWALLALALVSHVGGQTLIAYGFGHLPASFSAISLLWQPVVATATAWLVLHERLTWVQTLGAVIVLVGILLATGWRPISRTSVPAPRL